MSRNIAKPENMTEAEAASSNRKVRTMPQVLLYFKNLSKKWLRSKCKNLSKKWLRSKCKNLSKKWLRYLNSNDKLIHFQGKQLCHFHFCLPCQCRSGPSCSKLMASLVDVSLKFQTLISRIYQYFLLKKCEKLLDCKLQKLLSFLQQIISVYLVIKS